MLTPFYDSKKMEYKISNGMKNKLDLLIFVISAFAVSFYINWANVYISSSAWVPLAPFLIGMTAFLFQAFVRRRPLTEIFSKGYPYRKLKAYGVISAFLLFEFVLVWGIHTKQFLLVDEDLFLVIVLFIGIIAYYHAFVRMKISLRFLALAILIPALSAGASLGLASYFKMLKFVVPQEPIGSIVLMNTLFWIIFYTLFQAVCEEPAFRGYLMQGLLDKGELLAIVYSSVIYAVWRAPFTFFTGISSHEIMLIFCGNIVIGILLALLFIKSKNLLVAIICHGTIEGLRNSFYASADAPGIRQYIQFVAPEGETQLLFFWLSCLFIGLILLTFIPRKKLDAS